MAAAAAFKGDTMIESHQQSAAAFANAVIVQDYDAAHQMLAPWLQPVVSPARLREFVETELREVAEAAELDEMTYPSQFEIDGNSSTVDELRDLRSYRTSRRSNDEIPPEVTRENFRQWLRITFMPSEAEQLELDVDAWLDFWLILVETDGALRIGYFELEDPD